MNKLCDDEIDRLTTNINELNKKWSSHSKQNHYNKPHLFEKNSADVLNCGPKEQSNTIIIYTNTSINTNTIIGMMKLRLVREAVESWKIRKDRDMMVLLLLLLLLLIPLLPLLLIIILLLLPIRLMRITIPISLVNIKISKIGRLTTTGTLYLLLVMDSSVKKNIIRMIGLVYQRYYY